VERGAALDDVLLHTELLTDTTEIGLTVELGLDLLDAIQADLPTTIDPHTVKQLDGLRTLLKVAVHSCHALTTVAGPASTR